MARSIMAPSPGLPVALTIQSRVFSHSARVEQTAALDTPARAARAAIPIMVARIPALQVRKCAQAGLFVPS